MIFPNLLMDLAPLALPALVPPPHRPPPSMLTWATSERDLDAVAGRRPRRGCSKPLPPCGRAPRLCRALLAMSA